MPVGFHGVFAALTGGVVFALQGFEQAVQLAGEARNPRKDLPTSLDFHGPEFRPVEIQARLGAGSLPASTWAVQRNKRRPYRLPAASWSLLRSLVRTGRKAGL